MYVKINIGELHVHTCTCIPKSRKIRKSSISYEFSPTAHHVLHDYSNIFESSIRSSFGGEILYMHALK